MESNPREEDRVVALTDSWASPIGYILAKEPWAKPITNIKANYWTTYIPGHAGIWYNETADQLAGAAEPIGPIQLHHSDVRNRLWVQPTPKKTLVALQQYGKCRQQVRTWS